jgi:hypothetical protein
MSTTISILSNQAKKTADNTNSRESQKHQQEPRKKDNSNCRTKYEQEKRLQKTTNKTKVMQYWDGR